MEIAKYELCNEPQSTHYPCTDPDNYRPYAKFRCRTRGVIRPGAHTHPIKRALINRSRIRRALPLYFLFYFFNFSFRPPFTKTSPPWPLPRIVIVEFRHGQTVDGDLPPPLKAEFTLGRGWSMFGLRAVCLCVCAWCHFYHRCVRLKSSGRVMTYGCGAWPPNAKIVI